MWKVKGLVVNGSRQRGWSLRLPAPAPTLARESLLPSSSSSHAPSSMSLRYISNCDLVNFNKLSLKLPSCLVVRNCEEELHCQPQSQSQSKIPSQNIHLIQNRKLKTESYKSAKNASELHNSVFKGESENRKNFPNSIQKLVQRSYVLQQRNNQTSNIRNFHSDCGVPRNQKLGKAKSGKGTGTSYQNGLGFASRLSTFQRKSERCAFDSSNLKRGLTSFPIPGTSAAAAAQGLVKGTVVERQIWIDNEVFRRQELRPRIFEWHEPTMVAMGTVGVSPGTGSSRGNRISTEEITRVAEDFLGSERFSSRLTLSDNFAQFQQIICLFLFKVARFDHPLLYITNIIEAEARHNSGSTETKNPYPWWRSMMILLAAEMYGFPRDIQAAPPEVHWAIKDKQNRLGKIVEVAWITHQLHRRVLDISSISSRLSTLYPTSYPRSPDEQIELMENLHKANKAITLVGDLLLTQKCAHLAALKSPIALELICNSLADFCESEFELGIKSLKPQHFNYENWLSRCELGLGSLMGHCMYSALLFSGFDAKSRQRAFQLGSLMGILYQAYDDLSFFNRQELKDPSWLDVGILPVVYHVERNPEILLKSHPEIFNTVKSCRSTMDQSQETFQFLKEQTLKALSSHDHADSTTARDILINFIHSLNPLGDNLYQKTNPNIK